MTNASPLLVAKGLGRRGAGANGWLLQDVRLDVHAGDRVAIRGPTGSGKTLLLRALSLLDPVDAGQILWNGKAVSHGEVPHFRRQVVYLHQRPALIEGSVEHNLRLPYSLSAAGQNSFDRGKALELLGRLGRGADFLSHTDHNLSGGERQMVALVRALQLDPRILLLDEPTAALDRDATSAFERLILDWQRQHAAERAFVWVSHSTDQIERVANRIASLSHGRITEAGH